MIELKMQNSINPKKYFLFSNNELLLLEGASEFSLPDYVNNAPAYFIGNYNDHDCYAADITSLAGKLAGTSFPLKLAFHKCNKIWHNAMARAYQIIQWDYNHQFCGKCGEKTSLVADKFEKLCSKCGLSFFPRLSPAIIVLIKKDEQILMARQKNFADGVYSLIAGFVEAGEALEDAVHREVYEEVGLLVKNVRYYASQPWPFPDSLMIGFIADYDSGEIDYRDGEIEIAKWCTREDIPGYPSSTHSIAMQMIKDFETGIL